MRYLSEVRLLVRFVAAAEPSARNPSGRRSGSGAQFPDSVIQEESGSGTPDPERIATRRKLGMANGVLVEFGHWRRRHERPKKPLVGEPKESQARPEAGAAPSRSHDYLEDNSGGRRLWRVISPRAPVLNTLRSSEVQGDRIVSQSTTSLSGSVRSRGWRSTRRPSRAAGSPAWSAASSICTRLRCRRLRGGGRGPRRCCFVQGYIPRRLTPRSRAVSDG
jgi:hypothetical protein